MLDILNIVLPTFIVIFVGFLYGKKTKANLSAAVDLVFYVGFPALAFTSVIDKDIVLLDAAKMWASTIFIIFGCLLTAWIVFKVLRKKHSGLYIPIMMMNAVNIPFPIGFLAFGAEGLLAVTLFYIPTILVAYSVGIFIASKGKNWKESLKEVLKVPAPYAAVAGLLVNFNGITVPELVMAPLNVISLMVIPIVLLVLGANLSKVRLQSVGTTLLASFLRVGVGLAFGFLAVYLFDITGVFRAVVILVSAMPAAANASLLATKYNNEAELVSSVVFVTTIASLAVIPFVLSIL